MGHHCILTSITLLLAPPEAQEMGGQWYRPDEKVEFTMYLQLLKCGCVKVLVNMVYVTSIP